jgi:hypothetical protein
MQPDWRVDDKDKQLTLLARTAPNVPNDAWSSSTLCRSGPIGFRLIIMTLGWWGQVLNSKDHEERELQDKFLEAVEDVQSVLEQILNSFASKPGMKKRSADDDEPSGNNKRYVHLVVFINDT